MRDYRLPASASVSPPNPVVRGRPSRAVTAGLLAAMCAVGLAPTAAAAQSEGRAPRVLQLPASTRAMALGNAFMMNSGHADAVFYHPGLVRGASGFGMDIQVWSGEATAAAVSAAVDWYGGTVAVGLQTLEYGAPSGAVTSYPSGQDLLFDLGPAPTSERVASLAYARRMFGVNVGVTGKLVEQRVAGDRAPGAAVDVGLSRGVGPLTVGLSARNLGPDLELASGAAPLPWSLTLGAGAYGRPLGPFDVGLSGALVYELDEFVPGAGIELGYWPVQGRTFVARAGVRRVPSGDASPLTFGAAFWGDDLVLEWAYQSFGGTLDEASHRFGVRWR